MSQAIGEVPAGPWAAMERWAALRAGRDAAAVAMRLARLVATTLEAAARMNLTADREPRLFWDRHIEDAVTAATLLEEALGGPPAERFLDVGSGAGQPGLVWAILWPEVRADLLEARMRRVQFLRETADVLGLKNVNVLEGRAETVGRLATARGSYDVATARALAPMPVLLELTLPFVRVGGSVAAIKGADIAQEVAASRRALVELGGEPIRTLEYVRSDGKGCRLCLVRKGRATPDAYPRREGIPERKPLR